jgi:hypothetical protein
MWAKAVADGLRFEALPSDEQMLVYATRAKPKAEKI